MTIGKKEVTFRWSNYTKPTPANLERITGGLKDIMAGISGIAIVSEHYTASLVLTVSIIVLGQFVKFFASVAMEERNNPDNETH
jgi:hypothetical protein